MAYATTGDENALERSYAAKRRERDKRPVSVWCVGARL